jgi:hypothetical protein
LSLSSFSPYASRLCLSLSSTWGTCQWGRLVTPRCLRPSSFFFLLPSCHKFEIVSLVNDFGSSFFYFWQGVPSLSHSSILIVVRGLGCPSLFSSFLFSFLFFSHFKMSNDLIDFHPSLLTAQHRVGPGWGGRSNQRWIGTRFRYHRWAEYWRCR